MTVKISDIELQLILDAIASGNNPLQMSDKEINQHTANYRRSQARMGIPLPQETRDKISAALKGRSVAIVTCPHCGKHGGHAAMHRWHFDACIGHQR
jgi:hypothetical protein